MVRTVGDALATAHGLPLALHGRTGFEPGFETAGPGTPRVVKLDAETLDLDLGTVLIAPARFPGGVAVAGLDEAPAR